MIDATPPSCGLKKSTPGRVGAATGYKTAIAERLRVRRTHERFTQDELASEIGITRAALGNYEYCIRPLPFGVGLRWCARLDVNPSWLVEGGDYPEHPFVETSELGVPEFDIQRLASQRTSFDAGYFQLLRTPLLRWFERNPPSKLILDAITAGPRPVAKRMGIQQLTAELARIAGEITNAKDLDRLGLIAVARVYLDELEHRTKLARKRR